MEKIWEDAVTVLLAQSVDGKSVFKASGSSVADRDLFLLSHLVQEEQLHEGQVDSVQTLVIRMIFPSEKRKLRLPLGRGGGVTQQKTIMVIFCCSF